MNSQSLAPVARWFSIVGGLLLTALMLMTCYSLIGRNLFDSALIGDFELTGIGSGAAIAFFMPICQLYKENIIVDFFTARCSASTTNKLDRLGSLMMALIFALLAWRCTVGALSAKEAMGASMLMGFPDWIVFTCMAVPFALTAVIALLQTLESSDISNKAAA